MRIRMLLVLGVGLALLGCGKAPSTNADVPDSTPGIFISARGLPGGLGQPLATAAPSPVVTSATNASDTTATTVGVSAPAIGVIGVGEALPTTVGTTNNVATTPVLGAVGANVTGTTGGTTGSGTSGASAGGSGTLGFPSPTPSP